MVAGVPHGDAASTRLSGPAPPLPPEPSCPRHGRRPLRRAPPRRGLRSAGRGPQRPRRLRRARRRARRPLGPRRRMRHRHLRVPPRRARQGGDRRRSRRRVARRGPRQAGRRPRPVAHRRCDDGPAAAGRPRDHDRQRGPSLPHRRGLGVDAARRPIGAAAGRVARVRGPRPGAGGVAGVAPRADPPACRGAEGRPRRDLDRPDGREPAVHLVPDDVRVRGRRRRPDLRLDAAFPQSCRDRPLARGGRLPRAPGAGRARPTRARARVRRPAAGRGPRRRGGCRRGRRCRR